MDDSQFKLNPIVTLQHAYHLPPVGRSVWRKRVKDGDRVGIKAKTQYPPKPDRWPDGEWPPDSCFTLIQSGLLNGKSVGFLPTKIHAPDDKEREKNGWADVRLVIDEWVLLEYACCFIPCQQNAVVEAVAKGLTLPDSARQILSELFQLPPEELTPKPETIPFTTLAEITQAIQKRFAAIDVKALAEKAVRNRLDQLRGRV